MFTEGTKGLLIGFIVIASALGAIGATLGMSGCEGFHPADLLWR